MPSPFPGMDPYLEDPALWQDVHLRLITAMADALQPQLLPRYYTSLGERIYVEELRHAIYPDLTVLRHPDLQKSTGSSTAVLAADEPKAFAFETQHREPYLEVRGSSTHEVITVVELLSPANKANGRGREEYVRKQSEVLGSPASFVEIDLLRDGNHTVFVPWFHLATVGRFDYLVVLHRATERHHGFEYDFTVRDRLPRVRVPLAPGDQDAVLDLPSAFTQAYESGAYRLRVDYNRPPVVPLKDEDEAWADALLRDKGLRAG